MTDQESRRYRCPGCGNEERGALIEVVANAYGGEEVVNVKPWCTTGHCAVRLSDYQLIEEPEPEVKSTRSPREILAALAESIERVFDVDWDMTLDCIGDNHLINQMNGTFLCPNVTDESINWANRGNFLALFREAREVSTAANEIEPEPDGLVDGRYTSIAALEAAKTAQSEPEAEGAREWGFWKRFSPLWHRFPAGRWPTACGLLDDIEREFCNTRYSQPQGTPCPDCLPKPGEGKEPEDEEIVRCGCSDPTCTHWHDADGPAEAPPPPPAVWVPPEWDKALSYEGNLQCVIASFAEHVNARLAQPESDSFARKMAHDQSAAVFRSGMREADSEVARRLLAKRDAEGDDWTRVEDGLPGDRQLIQVMLTARYDANSTNKWIMPTPPTHWRYKPEEG